MVWVDSLKKEWSTVVTIGCIVVAAIVSTWQEAASGVPAAINIPRLGGVWHYLPLFLLIISGASWLLGRRRRSSLQGTPIQAIQPADAVTPGIPALSTLLGKNPQITFDGRAYFALAYYSPVTAEFERNIKIIAQQQYPNDKEGFYARFIGVGIVAYQHEVTWLTVYKSQLSAMAELNARGVVIPLADVKKHYDKAVREYPTTYTNYTFEQWMNYMQLRQLIVRHPTHMVEITHGGKDFLRFVAHLGWNIDAKTN